MKSIKKFSFIITVILIVTIVTAIIPNNKVEAVSVDVIGNNGIYGNISNPVDIEFDNQGNMYLANSFQVNKITTEGVITRIMSATEIRDMEFSSDGTLYVYARRELYKVKTDGNITYQEYESGGGTLIDGGTIEFDSDGNLWMGSRYFSESWVERPLMKISPDGNVTKYYSGGQFGEFDYVSDIIIDEDNSMLISTDRGIKFIDVNGNLVDEWTVVDPKLTKNFTYISDMEYNEKNGILYLSSYYYNVILKLYPDGGMVPVETNQEYGRYNGIRDIEFDDKGNMYICNFLNNTINVIDEIAPSTPIIDPIDDNDTTITGTAEPQSEISIYINDLNIIAIGNTDSNGNFSIEISQPLPAETSVQATATDDARNTSVLSQKIYVDISQGLYYKTHVQNIGWQSWRKDGVMSGTSGQALRLEGIQLKINDIPNLGISYTTHVQEMGWQDWMSDGTTSGTTGLSFRLEAIRIMLTGTEAENYDIYYRVHVQDYGWLDWGVNGSPAGSEGYGLRLEGIEVKLVAKGSPAPGNTEGSFISSFGEAKVKYITHIQNIGWQSWKTDGDMSGTSGRALRLEGIMINLGTQMTNGQFEDGSIWYSTHVQDKGWQSWSFNGAMNGTSGQALRLEAIRIKLNGRIADDYDIYYRVHVQDHGWLDWASNGGDSGTSGMSLRLEGIEIEIVPKGGPAPGDTTQPYISNQ